MEKTNSLTGVSVGERGKPFEGGPNSNPEFYLGESSPRAAIPALGSDFLLKHTIPGVAIKSAVEYAQSPEFKEKLDFGKEKLAEGVNRARSMIDQIRGAVPESVKASISDATDRLSPAIGPLRRGFTEAFGLGNDSIRADKESREQGR
jgi:hypothetical protein